METPPGEAKKQMSATELARLRRERRNAKIAAGGADRLAAITSLSGRPPPEPEEQQLTPKSQSHAPKPPTGQPPFPNQQMQMPPFPSQGGGPYETPDGADPMLAMLQQMLRGAGGVGGAGSAGGDPSQQDPFAGLPPGFAQLLGAAAGGAGGPGGPGSLEGNPSASGTPSQQDPFAGLPPGFAQLLGAAAGGQALPPQQNSYEYIWRIVHAVFSLLLGFYVALGTGFTGSEVDREEYVKQARFEDGLPYRFAERMFLVFATVEIGLQTLRYFLEKGQLPRSGLLGKISTMIPEPWANYVRVLGRYSVIWNTLVADALAVVFAFGLVSWLNSWR